MRRTINFLINLGEDQQEKKYSIGFLLDLSGSMQGEPLEQVKVAINSLLKPLVLDGGAFSAANQVSIVSFHTHVQKVCPWVDEDDFDFFREFLFGIPEMTDAIMKGTGATALFDGMAEILKSCYAESKIENERIILIFSDGCDFGPEQFTEQDVEKLVEKQNNGFILESKVAGITSKLKLSDYIQVFEKVKGKDYFVFKNGINEATIRALIPDIADQELLIRALNDTRKPVKICSLYYKDGDASPRGKAILQKFADLTGGLVFDAPTMESIPSVMLELFQELEYGKKSGVRANLIKQLLSTPIEGNVDWFRVFSINSFKNSDQKELVENPEGHTIFNLNMSECKSRNETFVEFNKTFSRKETDLRQLLISNLYRENQGFGNIIQTNPIIYITLKGNDLLGTSIPQALYKVLFEIRNDPNDILGTINLDYHVFIVILIDQLVLYTDDEKKNLTAFLNEINEFSFDKIHGIILLGERNDHFSANPNGYKTLSKTDFEKSVIENLYDLNAHQQLALEAYKTSFSARQANEDDYNRFISIGNVTVFADRDSFFNKISRKLCQNLLLNLYTDSFKTDPDSALKEVGYFLVDLKFSALKNQVISTDQGLNLLSRFDCPSALDDEFTDSWNEFNLKFIDQTNPGLQFITRTIHNRTFIEYIQHLYFDVRNYVESCHTSGTFNLVVQERLSGILKHKIEELRGITNRLMYDGDFSSPKQAELWVDALYSQIDQYITGNFLTDAGNDADIREYNTFSYQTMGMEITDDNPETPLGILREKLESFPLHLSIRLKYYSLAGLFTAGTLALFYAGVLPSLGLLPGLLVSFGTAILGEYRISQNFKQLRKLINWFGMAHRHRARRQALEFITGQINQMLIDLKSKIRKEDDTIALDQIYSDDLTEKNYLDLLRDALTRSLPKYFEIESSATIDSSPFKINITKGFYVQNGQKIDIMDDSAIEEMADFGKVIGNTFFSKLTARRGQITKYNFPTIKLSFIPPDFTSQLTTVSSKANVNLLLKLELTEIIPDSLFYLTLLEPLTAMEIAELKNLFNNKIWHQKVDNLVNLYNDFITVNDVNFFSLWREVGFYQAWIHKIARMVSEDDDENSKINSDCFFNLWKKMYQGRKEFREKLLTNSKEILSQSFNIDDHFNLWKIIRQSENKIKITNHIKTWSFSPIYLTNTDNSYSTYSKLNYLRPEKYSSNELKLQSQQNLLTLMDDKRHWTEFNSSLEDYLLFNHFVVIPIHDSSLLKSLATMLASIDFVENERGSWRNYFLNDFCEQHFKTKEQRKEYKWLFQQS